jgi:hypothetical protein
MTVQFNLFTWIREGVKQSVLLGVSDAVEQLGMPENDPDAGKQLMKFIEEDSSKNSKRQTGAKQKRLGRSLKDVAGGDQS